MTDLVAIVRATRRSAKAIKRAQIAKSFDDFHAATLRHVRALDDYGRAQAVLTANPLPGDK